ncbi:MAG: hypothetical protein VKJ64_08930 [Leptolyngbyaceae bacterium]|nr:hypothetical protein [Leptolyngbyaceae bacterium]
MNTQEQARALMMRHHQMIKNRQQSMLERSLEEAGIPGDVAKGWSHVQGKPSAAAQASYDRSRSAFS